MQADRAAGSKRHRHRHPGIDRATDRLHMVEVMDQRHHGIDTQLAIPATPPDGFVHATIDGAARAGTRDDQRVRVAPGRKRHADLVRMLVQRYHALYLRAPVAMIVNALREDLILDVNGRYAGPFELADR